MLRRAAQSAQRLVCRGLQSVSSTTHQQTPVPSAASAFAREPSCSSLASALIRDAVAQRPAVCAHFSSSQGWLRSFSGAGLATPSCFPAASTGSRLGLIQWPQVTQTAAFAHKAQPRPKNKLKPKFLGGKLKPYSSYKERFKLTGTGKVLFPGLGHVHKRFNKGRQQRLRLSKTKVLHLAYAKTMKRLGFKMTTY